MGTKRNSLRHAHPSKNGHLDILSVTLSFLFIPLLFLQKVRPVRVPKIMRRLHHGGAAAVGGVVADATAAPAAVGGAAAVM